MEPRLEAARFHGVRRRRRSVSHRHRRHGQHRDEKKKRTTPSPASRTRRSASASSPRGRPGSVGRSLRLFADSFLISDVGWWPDSSAAYCYVQNRTQTWLDLVKVSTDARGLGQAPVPRLNQGLDREPRADPLAGRRLVPLAQRARRLEASLPLRRSDGTLKAAAHLGTLGGPRSSSTSIPRTAGSTSRHPRQPGGGEPLPRQARAARSSDSRRQTEATPRTMSPDGKLFRLELVRHSKLRAHTRLYARRRPARPHARLQPVVRAQAAAVRPARANARSRPRTVSCWKPS